MTEGVEKLPEKEREEASPFGVSVQQLLTKAGNKAQTRAEFVGGGSRSKSSLIVVKCQWTANENWENENILKRHFTS